MYCRPGHEAYLAVHFVQQGRPLYPRDGASVKEKDGKEKQDPKDGAEGGSNLAVILRGLSFGGSPGLDKKYAWVA